MVWGVSELLSLGSEVFDMNSSETLSGIKSFYFGFGGTRWVPWRTEVIGSTR